MRRFAPPRPKLNDQPWSIPRDRRPYGIVAPYFQAIADQSGATEVAFSFTPGFVSNGFSVVFSVADGYLPSGLSLNPSTSQISGTPLVDGYGGLEIVLAASYSLGVVFSEPFTITIISSALSPVLSGLIHWHETAQQDPVALTSSPTDSYYDNLAAFTFVRASVTYRPVFLFPLQSGQAAVDTAVLNGQDALRYAGSSAIFELDVATSLSAPQRVMADSVLATSAFTIQWLLRANVNIGSFEELMQIRVGDNTLTGLLFFLGLGAGGDLKVMRGDASGITVLWNTVAGDNHLLTVHGTPSGSNCIVDIFVDYNFVTPVASFTLLTSVIPTAAFINMTAGVEPLDANSPRTFAMLVYNRSLSDAELTENADYLRDPTKYGASAF